MSGVSQLAALGPGDPAGGDAHGLGELGLGEAVAFAFFGEPLAAMCRGTQDVTSHQEG